MRRTGGDGEPFVDPATLDGVQRIRRYALAWLERLDYADRLDRGWPPEELGMLLWSRLEREYAAAWEGPVVRNRPLAEVVATTMVEDYWEAFPTRRESRYTVRGPLGDAEFRRAVVDWLQDLEEFEPGEVPRTPKLAAEGFWRDLLRQPERWGYDPERGPLLDDPERAREVALEALRDYYALLDAVERRRAARGAE